MTMAHPHQLQPQPQPHPHPHPQMPPPPPLYNSIEMTREMLQAVLERFSEKLEEFFDLGEIHSGGDDYGDDDEDDEEEEEEGEAHRPGEEQGSSSGERGRRRERRKGRRKSRHQRHRQEEEDPHRPRTLRLTVHGGACMLLHPGLYGLSLQMPMFPVSVSHPSPSGGPSDASDAAQDPPSITTNMRLRDLPRRTTTRDVDIIMRGFVADFGGVGAPRRRGYGYPYPASSYPGMESTGYPPPPGGIGGPGDLDDDDPAQLAQMDAAARLKACIRATAKWHFPGLGADWMNADPDQALPLAIDPTTHTVFDPLHLAAQAPNNRTLYTIFRSKNRRLELVSVPPYWSVALKLVRWGNRDWGDVGVLLRNGILLSRNLQWTPELLLNWLEKECWAMGYSRWDERKMAAMREKVAQAVRLVEGFMALLVPALPEPVAVSCGCRIS